MSRSLMNCQMIRVISSPSSSTTVPSTLIFSTTPGASSHLGFVGRGPAYPFGQISRYREILSPAPVWGLACSHAGAATGGADRLEHRGRERAHAQARSAWIPRTDDLPGVGGPAR